MYRILLNDIFMFVGSKSFKVTSVTQDCILFNAWRRVIMAGKEVKLSL
jgi:hypothetical protein